MRGLVAVPCPPEGTPSYERIPTRTLEIIGQIFPGDHGLRFLALLLRSAEIKQLAFNDINQDVAILNIGSVTRFAKEHGYSKDTALRYIAVLQAIGLLFFTHQKQLCLKLEFQPSAGLLSALDRLIANSRQKQQSLARRVRAKISMYIGQRSPSHETVSLSHSSTVVREDLEQILEEEGIDGARRARIVQRCLERLNQTIASGSLQPLQDREHLTSIQPVGDRESKRETGGQKGDRLSSLLPQSIRQKGDREPEKETTIAHRETGTVQKGDRFAQQEGKRETVEAQKGDRSAQQEGKKETGTVQKGDRLGQKGDRLSSMVSPDEQKGDREVVANVNVNTILRNINVNVNAVAQVICQILGEKPSKQGIYTHLFTKEQCNRPDAVGAALVYTLYLQARDGSLGNPAAFFLARCRQFHKGGISSEAADLAAKYGDMTCQQIMDAARKPQAPAQQHTRRRQTPSPILAETTPVERDRMSLSKDEADGIAQEIRRHPLVSALIVKPLRNKATGQYALLLATPSGTQTVLYTREQWEAKRPLTNWKQLFEEGQGK